MKDWRQLTGRLSILVALTGMAPPPVWSAEPTMPVAPKGAAGAGRGSTLEQVSFGGGALTGYLARPRDTGKPVPAVVALHGCGGLFNASGALNSRHSDWAARWTGAGYSVLFPDSFGSRGLGSQCQVRDRVITPRARAGDAAAAADWLAAQPFADPARLALIGWSNGGSTVLWALDRGAKPAASEFRTAVAFYPGCRIFADRAGWAPRLPLTLLIGGADDWTPPEPCRTLHERHRFAYREYPGAFHDFDAPNAPVRIRKGLTFTKSGDGTAHVGTDPAARTQAIETVTQILADAFR